MRGQVGAPVSRRRLVSKGKRMKVKPRLMYVVWLLCRSLWAAPLFVGGRFVAAARLEGYMLSAQWLMRCARSRRL